MKNNLSNILKEIELLKLKLYSGQSTKDSTKDLTKIEQMIFEAFNGLKCRECGGNAKLSKGYGNAYGKPDLNGKRTVLEGKGDFIDCLKCENCGHSWVL